MYSNRHYLPGAHGTHESRTLATFLQPGPRMLTTPSNPCDAGKPPGVNDAVRRDVTVVIAAWRAAATIGRAVASALAQPEAAEVVVVDDASNDEGATLAAARAADDGSGRLSVMALEFNSGPAHARNVAIRASKATWITVLDSDDFMEPGRLAKLMALTDAGYDLIADDLKQVEEGADIATARPMWFDPGQEQSIDISLSFFISGLIPKRGRMRRELGFIKPLMRRTFLERHALSYDASMRLGEDFDLYARVLLNGGKMRLAPWTGYMSVMRRNSLSLNHSRADILGFEASKDRLLASGRLSPEEARLVRKLRANTHSRVVWIDVMAAVKSGKVLRAGALMLKNPRQAPHVVRKLGLLALDRVRGGKR